MGPRACQDAFEKREVLSLLQTSSYTVAVPAAQETEQVRWHGIKCSNSCLTVMLWEDKDLQIECVQSQDWATGTRKKERRGRRRKEEEEEELFF